MTKSRDSSLFASAFFEQEARSGASRALWVSLGAAGWLLERSWALWALLGALGVLLVALGALLGFSWALLGGSWSLLGRSWGALEALLGRSWALLGAPGTLLGRSLTLLGDLGSILEPPRVDFGASWGRFGTLQLLI